MIVLTMMCFNLKLYKKCIHLKLLSKRQIKVMFNKKKQHQAKAINMVRIGETLEKHIYIPQFKKSEVPSA